MMLSKQPTPAHTVCGLVDLINEPFRVYEMQGDICPRQEHIRYKEKKTHAAGPRKPKWLKYFAIQLSQIPLNWRRSA